MKTNPDDRAIAEAKDGMSKSRICRCGHTAQAHLHYRKGTDCAMCGCLIYEAARLVRN